MLVSNSFDFISKYYEQTWDRTLSGIYSLGQALEIVINSLNVTLRMSGYVPAIIGASLIITLSVMAIRFLLLK